MTEPAARSLDVRKQDTLKRLAEDVDAWVATASPDGSPYLMPLSFLWTDDTVLLSTALKNPTSLNIQASGQIHLAIGQTRDVILITGTAELVTPEDLPQETADAFATKAGFDPRAATTPYPYFRVTPTRIQAWREVNELKNRDLMQDGSWLV